MRRKKALIILTIFNIILFVLSTIAYFGTKENLEIFDFALEPEEMEQIRKIDKNQRYFTVPIDQLEGFLAQFNPSD